MCRRSGGGTYFARFYFVKLLPLRGRYVCAGGQEVRRSGGGTYFARFYFVIYFLLRAPSGPLMGTLSGTHVGTPMGHPLFKNKNIKPFNIGGIEPQPIKLEFTIYPTGALDLV